MALVSKRNVSSSTQRQALSSLLFLYGKVLGVDLPWLEEIGRQHEVKRLPVCSIFVVGVFPLLGLRQQVFLKNLGNR